MPGQPGYARKVVRYQHRLGALCAPRPMRILHVNKYLYRRGGAEAYMLDLAGMQAARGDEVAYFGMQHPDNDPSRYAAHFPPLVELEPAPDSLADRARAVARMFWSPASREGMAAVLAEFEPDVVHLHN